ncbi:MAG: RNA-binding protein [Candidatus Woesearchaeota archaeon]
MKRKRLKKSDIRKLNEKVSSLYGIDVPDKNDIVEEVSDEYHLIFVNGKPLFFYHGEKMLPTLKLLLEHDILRHVIVDMGAVRFVTNGADVMRPGIVQVDPEIIEGEAVSVLDENNRKPLGIGIALFSGKDMQEKESGKVLSNIHHIGDPLWNM